MGKKITVSDSIYAAKRENAIFIAKLEEDGYFEIDGLAADIWASIPELKSREALLETFQDSDVSDMDQAELSEKINALIDQFIELGLIEEK